jgi:L,D-transpeptidase-like protein
MRKENIVKNAVLGMTAAAFVGAPFSPRNNVNGPVLTAAVSLVTVNDTTSPLKTFETHRKTDAELAVAAFGNVVTSLSDPRALSDAFTGYFAYKTAHPEDVKKPFLYFVDYGLPSTKPRGYVFNMVAKTIVDGPFMVAQGRGSSPNKDGIPTVFSNRSGSAATSLGLYVAKDIYSFTGHTGGQTYSSIGLRLDGKSTGFNDNAFGRGVVAHGAPYVTSTRAGRSEGCPALEPARAQKLLPMLANGGVVFLFAPRADWLASDPWVTSGGVGSSAGAVAVN